METRNQPPEDQPVEIYLTIKGTAVIVGLLVAPIVLWVEKKLA